MIEIATYLRAPEGGFVPVDAVREPPPDPYYIEGAIELTVNGVQIIDQAMWDYVDQLWAYIGDMIQDLARGGAAETYFPDQPIRFTFTRTAPDSVLVSIESGATMRRSQISESELVEALRSSGAHFFDVMMGLFPNDPGYGRDKQAFLS